MAPVINSYAFVSPTSQWTQRLNFLDGTGAFPDANGWAVTGQTAKRTFVGGEGMRVLDASTSGGQLCQFTETDIDPGDAPFHLRTTVKCAAASGDGYASYTAAYGSDRAVELVLRATKIRWQGIVNVDITLDMTTFHQIDLLRIADTMWVLFIDGVYQLAGQGFTSTANMVELGAGSSSATSDTTWKDWACKVGTAYLPSGQPISNYQSVTAGGDLTSSGTVHDAFPGAVLCPDGTYLAMWRSGASHTSLDGEIHKSVSTDGGATWSSPSAVFTFGTNLNAVALTRERNRIIVTFADEITALDNLVSYFAYSDDSGATWSTPAAIDHGFTDFGVVASPIVAEFGNWYVPIWGRDTGDAHWSVRIVESSDQGATWSTSSTVYDGPTEGDDGTEGCLVTVGTEWICALRRENAGDIAFYAASSPAGPWTLRSTYGGLGRPLMHYTRNMLWLLNRNTGGTISQSWDAGLNWIPTMNTSAGSASGLVYGQFVDRPDGKVLLVYAAENGLQTFATVQSDILTIC